MNFQPFYLFDSLAQAAALLWPKPTKTQYAWIIDEGFWATQQAEGLKLTLSQEAYLLIPEGEKCKTWQQLGLILNWLAQLDQASITLIAVGGGACLDIAGLAAHLYKRGVPLIHLPTTVLAMVDASLGGKCASNLLGYKNLLGAYHPAAMIIANLEFLGSDLSKPWVQAGLSEIYKHGLIGDAQILPLFRSFILKPTLSTLKLLIQQAADLKQKVVCLELLDEYRGLRDLLNLGHTVGHAIESAALTDANKTLKSHQLVNIDHGLAVAIGLMVETFVFAARGSLSQAWVDQIVLDLKSLILNSATMVFHLPFEILLLAMRKDKKNRTSAVTLSQYGPITAMIQRNDVTAYLSPVTDEEIEHAWNQCKRCFS